MPEHEALPSPQDLQFQHAEPVAAALSPEDSARLCVGCRQPAGDTYYQHQDRIVCVPCAQQIQANQKPVPGAWLWRAALYGGGAALAGSALYAAVAIFLNLEIGIIAILVGWMVGKAIRHACQGRGGRPQQIMAVVLTYFAISTSYIPVMVYQLAKHPSAAAKQQQAKDGQVTSDGAKSAAKSTKGLGSTIGMLLIGLLTLAAIAPFLSLTSGISGLISLFILFIGMQRAWKLTERRQVPLTGPFTAEAAQ